MSKSRAVIKKYGNRRMYDSASSRYVNLEDIARMVRGGADIQVLDARTGKDLTRATLTQIIVDDARDQQAGLPLQLLRKLVVASDRVSHDFLSWYLDSAVELYHKAEAKVRSPLDYVRGLLPADTAEVMQLRERVEELERKLERETRPRKHKRRPK